MRKRTRAASPEEAPMPVYVNDEELCMYTGLGLSSARRLANELQAVRHVGKRRLTKLKIVIDYIESKR